MGLVIRQRGDLRKTKKFLRKAMGLNYRKILEKYGQIGVDQLEKYTPKDTGYTAACWYYKIVEGESSISVVWNNSHVENGWANVAILLQYGHATRNGGYVEGIDYINPALKPIFDDLAKAAWKEVNDT